MAIKVGIISTKGGAGKTTLAANLGGILVDLGQRVLMVDADTGQPALSSFYPMSRQAPEGLTQLFLADPNTLDPERVISTTTITGLDIIYSNDPMAELQQWVLNQPDGRMRLKAILNVFDTRYDFIIIDTRGSVGPVQDAAAIAADLLISPIPPEMLSAREFVRGTLEMLNRLKPMEMYGFPLGMLYGVINKMDRTTDAKLITQELRGEGFRNSKDRMTVCETIIPAAVIYRSAATQQTSVHRLESRQRQGSAHSALDTMLSLVHEIFPHLVDERLNVAEVVNIATARRH